MKARRLVITVMIFWLINLTGTLLLNRMFYMHASESIEAVRQRMVEDGAPAGFRGDVITGLEELKSSASSYVMSSGNMQFTLSAFMLIAVLAVWRKE
jgi:hypothetical protein